MPPSQPINYLLARLAGAPIAFPVTSVKEILRAVSLTSIPAAPPIIEGALNLRGRLVPVIDLRLRLGLAAKQIVPEDNLIVLEVGPRLIAVRVDATDDVESIDEGDVLPGSALTPVLHGVPVVAGVATRPDGAFIVYDPAAFMTEAERLSVDAAIAATIA